MKSRINNSVIVYMLRVFTDPSGNYGDMASIIVDEGKHIADSDRQAIARKLNTGETIFINNLETASVSVMHPQGEISFAGVGVLATAWLLSKLRDKPTKNMQGRDGEIICWQDQDLIWTQAPLKIMPQWNFKQRVSKLEIEEMKVEYTKDIIHTMFWAWTERGKGMIHARTFASDWDIPEAEGNGSGAMVLAARLNREIEIKHGRGSVMFAKPALYDAADLGGRVAEDTTLSVNIEEFRK